jgi:hypothetical protein
MNPLRVTKCICKKITFADVLDYAIEHNIKEVETLRENGICCTNCRMCEPYVRITLEKGQTTFEPGEYLKNRAG